MADTALQERIIQLLSRKKKQSEPLTRIIQTLRQPKKAINVQLYILEKNKRVIKVQESPPIWALRVPGNPQLSVSHSRGVRDRTSRRRGPELLEEDHCNLQQQILQCLTSNSSPLKAVVIAKKVGLEKAGDVNPTLYKLLEDGLVQKGPGKPLVWQLAGDATAVQAGACGSDGAQFSGAVPPIEQEGRPPDQQFYSFQDSQLFKTDSATEFDFSTSNTRREPDYDPSDSNISTNPDFDPSAGDRSLNFDGTLVVKTEGQGLMEAGGDIFPAENSTDEDMTGFDGNFGMKTEPTFEQEQGAFGTNANWNQGNFGNSNHVFDTDSAVSEVDDNNVEYSDRDMEEYVPTKKPRTFRDMFGLDGEMSHSSCEDSLGAGMSPCSAQNEDMQSEDTPQVFPSVIDDSQGDLSNLRQDNVINTCSGPETNVQDENVTVSVEIKESANGGMFGQSGSFGNSNYSLDVENRKSYENLNSKEVVLDYNVVDNDNQGDTFGGEGDITDEHINSLIVEPDSEMNYSGASGSCENVGSKKNVSNGSGLSDECNSILKTLASGLGLAQFVLLKKVTIEPDHVQDVLQKCSDLGYITGSTKLWKITPEGKTYVEENLNCGKTSLSENKSTPQSVEGTASKAMPRFTGPPPSPRDILRAQGSTSAAAAGAVGVSTPQSTANKYGAASLPVFPNAVTTRSQMLSEASQLTSQFSKPPVGQGTVRQSAAKRSHTDPTSSGPMPLMSLQLGQGTRGNSSEPSLASSSYSSFGPLNAGLWDVGAPKMNEPAGNRPQAAFKQNVRPAFKQPTSMPANVNRNIQTTNLVAPRARQQQDAQAEERLVIPEKFSDYPNRITSQQCLKMTTQGRKPPAPSACSPAAFKKGPPPTPMDILTKTMKKTDISPNKSMPQMPTSVHSSSPFLTQTQVSSITNPSGSLFPSRPTQQVTSPGYSNNNSRNSQSLPVTMNQAAFPRGFNATGMGSNLQQSGPKSLGGPPPSPASMLGRCYSAPGLGSQQQQMAQNALGLALSTENFSALNKNPISALMEYAQSRKMQARLEVISKKGSSHRPTFEIAAFVGTRRFPSVFCHNKKDGKQEASDVALRKLIAEDQFKGQTTGAGPISISPSQTANMTHFDKVAALTHRGFTALVSQIKGESFAGRKVIAGLIMKRSEDDTGVLVSFGTGNRCITGQQLSLQGNTVNDSHAEIITRRGFIRFLYKQLLEYDSSKPHPMFEPSQRGKLRIRSNITFHLYISTAPCGDGALFSPRDAEAGKAPVDTRIRPQHEPTFTSNVQGILRTKVEGGEGTIPIEAGFNAQTFDGIQRGERLRTMSCTDKICRWNVVGMQGALISHFLEPVYLDSLTLGQLYDHGHLSRAVCCRVGCGQPDISTILPPSFHLNHPWLGRVTVCDPPREVQKTKAISINWSFGDSAPEVTDGTLGLCVTSIEREMFSRCSKRKLFASFKAVCEKFNRPDLLHIRSYNEAKVASQDFVAAKDVMLQRFKQNGFGKWVSKPVEEEMFTLEDNG